MSAAFYLRVAGRLSLKSHRRIGPWLDADLRRWRQLRHEDDPFEAVSDDQHLEWAVAWLVEANRRLNGRGFPTKYSLGPLFGLGPPYPETTGYTICTLLTILRREAAFPFLPLGAIRRAAVDSLRFLMTTQLDGGAFSGGHALMKNHGRPSVFNTGQILLGLCDALDGGLEMLVDGDRDRIELRDGLLQPVHRAASFMADQVLPEGAFHPRYTYLKGSKTYYSRAAYGLLRAGVVLNESRFIEASRRHFDWVVERQRGDGWIDHWGFDETFAVLHTIAYTLRGLIEAGLYFKDNRYRQAVERSLIFLHNLRWRRNVKAGAEPLCEDASRRHNAATGAALCHVPPAYVSADGRVVPELCVTGLSQLAIVLRKYMAFSEVQDGRWTAWFDAMVTTTKRLQPRGFRNPMMNGVMPASWPLEGRYQPNDFIEWGTKFFADTILLSKGVPAEEIRG